MAAQGGYAGGRPPFGYEARGGALHVKPEEAAVVKWIFERVARDGWTIRRVADHLDREGTLARRWRPSEVGRILRREDYKCGPSGSRIVDPKVWNRASAILTQRRKS